MTYAIDENALFKIQYGMYLVSSKTDDKQNAQIATTVMQITNTPNKFVVGLSNTTLTHSLVKESGVFGVTVLEQNTPMTFIGRFGFKSGRDIDKLEGIDYETNQTGVPLILDHGLMVLEAKVIQTLDVGTHTLFVGELVSNRSVKEGAAMTYEYYHSVIRGKSPENAPTHVKS